MQHTPLNMGIGLNPIFTSHPEFIPDFIDFVECGPDDLPKLATNRLTQNLFLHIARSPICDDVLSQDKFISAIAAKTKNHDFTSIGLHVTGPRLSGIGCYGFSSHYTPSKENEELISGFVKKIQDKFGKPVWLENVNFYSESKGAVFRVHESINHIADRCQASQIADLTHLYVDAHNVGVDETALIGAINWASVVEIHLAGTITSRNGVKHDGHSNPVPDQVWHLYEKIVDYRLIDSEVIVTIEHTDPSWLDDIDGFKADYIKAADTKNRLSKSAVLPFELEPGQFAIGYIKRKIRQRLPHIDEVLNEHDHTMEQMLDAWLAQLAADGINLVLSEAEADLFWRGGQAEFYGESFVHFCNNRLGL
ncbi:MAG: DUF692 family multinuclear iron-containing protein [Candidatus Puniceispirillaceae bacterium]